MRRRERDRLEGGQEGWARQVVVLDSGPALPHPLPTPRRLWALEETLPLPTEKVSNTFWGL